MAVLEILTAPHPLLELKARKVEDDEFGPELERLLSDMAETMYAAPGVGLAGPQVGDTRRILVLDPGEKEERGKRFFTLCNPVILEKSKETIPWNETCLSVPEFEVEIRRAKRVRVSWQQGNGERREAWFEDYESVIVQHELDHLEGTVLLDRASLFKRSRYLKKVKARAMRERVISG
jgi:peptide deformylase